MTATILMIRHASHGHLGRVLSGRSPDIPLSELGTEEARALADDLAAEPITRLHASPVQRAQETARAIGDALNLSTETVDALNEVDFGEWTARTFDVLSDDPDWRKWNETRSLARPPGGETMQVVQKRAAAHVRATAAAYPGETIAMVSHCDVIRAVVADVLDLSIDRMLSFDVDPASVTRIVAGDWGMRLVSLNQQVRR